MPNGDVFEPIESAKEAEAKAISDAEKNHRDLDHFRSVLKREISCGDAGAFLYAGKQWENLSKAVQDVYLEYLRNRYADWKIANDDDFWMRLHSCL